jgi:hypothetical protein
MKIEQDQLWPVLPGHLDGLSSLSRLDDLMFRGQNNDQESS